MNSSKDFQNSNTKDRIFYNELPQRHYSEQQKSFSNYSLSISTKSVINKAKTQVNEQKKARIGKGKQVDFQKYEIEHLNKIKGFVKQLQCQLNQLDQQSSDAFKKYLELQTKSSQVRLKINNLQNDLDQSQYQERKYERILKNSQKRLIQGKFIQKQQILNQIQDVKNKIQLEKRNMNQIQGLIQQFKVMRRLLEQEEAKYLKIKTINDALINQCHKKLILQKKQLMRWNGKYFKG